MKVLVADDDPITLRLLTHALETLGYDVCAVPSGNDAWCAFQHDEFPVVVSDWMMPGVDGLELCRRIRKTNGEGYTYVILLSAQNERTDRLRALEAGVDDFLSKPLDRAELAARLVIARRIHYWESSLRTANDELRLTSELLAAQAEELERMREEAVRLATYDAMTNVYSRRAWFELLTPDLVALAIADVDHFKSINDTYGHPVGDVVLETVARRLDVATRPTGVIGRVGGEEFGIAFYGPAEVAVKACEEAVAAFAEPVDSIAEGTVSVSVSIGVALRKGGSQFDVATLYERADRALYEAKARGRNRIAIDGRVAA
jgi:diguanylate cyclase (GGDEF)-like protein